MQWVQLIISMIGIIGLILFMFYLLRKVNKGKSFVSGSRLRIIDRANLGRDSALAVVCVCGKLMLIGVSAGRIEKICDLPLSEEEYLGSGVSGTSVMSFSDILANMGIRKKAEQKNEDDLFAEKETERENGTDENAGYCDKAE